MFRHRTPAESIELVALLLEYTPGRRIQPLEACAHVFFDELRDPNARLSLLYCHPEAQGQGHGRALVKAAETAAAQENLAELHTERERGDLDEQAYHEAVSELEHNAAVDLQQPESGGQQTGVASRGLFVALLVVLLARQRSASEGG